MSEEEAKEKAEKHSNFLEGACEAAWTSFLDDAQKWRAGDMNEIKLRDSFIGAVKIVNIMSMMHLNALA